MPPNAKANSMRCMNDTDPPPDTTPAPPAVVCKEGWLPPFEWNAASGVVCCMMGGVGEEDAEIPSMGVGAAADIAGVGTV